MKTALEHIPSHQKFIMHVDEDVASVTYRMENNIMFLMHSEVPLAQRGQGIGTKLVEKTFDYIQKHQINAIAICSHIRWVKHFKHLSL